MRRNTAVIALLGGLFAGGCASGISETHFFRSNAVDGKGLALNYYRIHVSGGTMLSSSRYLSGYFDEKALDTYFNEFSQPANGAITPAPTTNPSVPAPAAGGVQPLDPSGAGKKLLLILSSNSDDIASQIGTLAQSDALSADLVHLFGASSLNASKTSVATQQRDQVVASSIVQTATLDLSKLDATAPPAADTSASMLAIANQLAGYLGARQQFNTLDDVNTWLRANGAAAITRESK
jgi:hypothetical protein